MREPMKHQRKVLDILKDQDRYGLFLSPGLGKTFTTLHDWYFNGSKNLIVMTLPSLLPTWEEETKKMGFPTPVHVLKFKGGKSIDQMLKDVKKHDRGIYIISYGISNKLDPLLFLEAKDFDIAFDESHKIKNRGTANSKIAVKLAKRFNKIRLLTGTPMSIGWEDYYVPLKLLGEDDPTTNTVKAFEENYMLIERMSNFSNRTTYQKVVGYKNLETLKEIINRNCIFMNEESAGVELPEQIEKIYYLEEDYSFKKAMKDRTYGEWVLATAGAKMMAHRTGLSGFLYGSDKFGERIVETFPKQPKKDIFKDILESIDSKIIVFYNFEQEVEDIKEVSAKLGKKTSRIRAGEIDTSGDVIITHYASGSTGLNLQEINHILYYSPTIVGSDFQQSKKRTHRIGQDKTCFYYHLITKDSLEEKIFEKIKLNQDYTEEMFEDEYRK